MPDLTVNTIEEMFRRIKQGCKTNFQDDFSYIFDFVFARKSNFIGGCGDRRTTHEKMFSLMFPYYRKQVVFGTGRGGMEKYLCKKYTADFFDPETKTVIEIDGNSHKKKLQILKDELRLRFFLDELKIRTVRLTNHQVEEMLLSRLKLLEAEGKLQDVS